MFVNISNHSISMWPEEQIRAAEQWGQIVDYPFPNVTADTTEEEIQVLSDLIVQNVVEMKPDAVMCQGEFTLTFSVVKQLKEFGIPVMAACSERVVEEKIGEDGNYEKVALFKFVKFRNY